MQNSSDSNQAARAAKEEPRDKNLVDPFDISRELSHAPRPVPGRPSNIVDFYNNRSVLITGASGFIGKVLIEKLLRTCPNIRRIFVLIRPKWNKLPQDRLRELLEAPLFDGVRGAPAQGSHSSGLRKQDEEEQEGEGEAEDKLSYLSERVQLVEGDVTQVNLGLSKQDLLRIMNEVSVIFHSAATVKFDEPLKQSIAINIAGTKNMLDVCRRIPQLAALVHVSTAYANCQLEEIDEHIYPVENMEDPERLIKMADWLDQDTLQELKGRLLGSRPNTYTYTKALAEWLLVKCGRDLPVVVCRPSIVVASWREPFSGWIDNVNGPTGIILGAGKGLIRSMFAEPSYVADLIPVDTVINLVVTLGWFAHIYKSHQLRQHQMNLSEAAESLSDSLLLASSASSASSGPSSIAPSSLVGDDNDNDNDESFYIEGAHSGQMSPPVSMGSVDLDQQVDSDEEEEEDFDDGLGSSGAQSDENDTNNNNSARQTGANGGQTFHHPNHDLYSAAAVAAAAAVAVATSNNNDGHRLLDDGYGSSLSPGYAPSIASSASSSSLGRLHHQTNTTMTRATTTTANNNNNNNNNNSSNNGNGAKNNDQSQKMIRKRRGGGKTMGLLADNGTENNNIASAQHVASATSGVHALNRMGAFNQQQFHIEQRRLNDEKQADFDYKLKQFRHQTRAKLLAKNLPEHLADIPVFHCTSGGQNPISWGRLQVLVMTICAIFPSITTYRYPSGDFTNNHYLDKFYSITLHYLPGYLADFITKVFGGKPILVKIFKKFDQAANVLKAFTSKQWKFDYDNRMTLINELMTQEDRRLFNCDIKSLNWGEFILGYVVGVRKFMLKEPMNNLDEARKNLTIVYYRNLSLQILITSLIAYCMTPSIITTTMSSLASSVISSLSSLVV